VDAAAGDASNTTVFVGGIDASITEDVLREHFAPFGEVSLKYTRPYTHTHTHTTVALTLSRNTTATHLISVSCA
jgi:RNA recognition motif-containing protein